MTHKSIMKPIKIFNYFPVDISNAHTGRKVKGFKFPANEVEGYDINDLSPRMRKIFNNFNYTSGSIR